MTKPMVNYGPTHFYEISDLIDVDRPVQVYKNLHTGTWSVRQDGVVKVHTDYITLKNVKFKVGQKGRERVLREKAKNVHAFVQGYLCSVYDLNNNVPDFGMHSITYNPYLYDSFVNCDNDNKRVDTADFCDMMAEDSSPVIAFNAR